MKRLCLLGLLLLLSWPAAAADTTLVFNEVGFTSSGRLRWVEFYNQLAVNLDVSGWTLESQTFPAGTVVKGRSFMVVAADAAAVAELSAAGVTNVIGPMTNLFGRLVLRNNSHREMDTFDATVVGRTPVHALPEAFFSWAKLDRELSSAAPESWTLNGPAHGSPGRDNFPVTGQVQSQALIGIEDTWRYNDSGTDLGAAWPGQTYDDAAWASGRGLLYYGTNRFGSAKSIPTLYNSGVGANGQVLAAGALDPHYRLTVSAQGGAPVDATVVQNHPNWLANDSSSMWVGPLNPGTANAAQGNYYYRTTFSLQGFDAATAQIQMMLAVDDNVTALLLNGVTTPITAAGFAALSGPFYLTNGFVAGTNTLEFQCLNGGVNPTGLRVIMSGTAFTPITNTPVAAGRTTYYYRRPFPFYGDPERTKLKLRPLVDDGAVYYLNGTEIFRQNMPGGSVNASTLALTNVLAPNYSGPFSVIPTNLLTGTNILAVEVHQAAGGTDDMLFGLELTAEPYEPPPVTLAINEISGATNATFWLELVNYGTNPVPLDGCSVHLQNAAVGLVFSNRPPLLPGAFLVLTDSDFGLATNTGFRYLDKVDVTLWSPNDNRVYDTAVIRKALRGRLPDGTGPWLWPAVATPGTNNQVSLHNEIVINEIMYKPPLNFDSNNVPQDPVAGWLELYNRSSNAVDLTGWTLDGGVTCFFPTGKTLAAGAYLVVANKADNLRAGFPGLEILGNLGGNLSGKGDSIILRDAMQNPVNFVRYFDGGHWAEDADGGGSSLELRDPWADNSQPQAWAASDETRKTTWQTYSYRMIAGYPSGTQPTQWNDFVLGLLAGGECLIDDIRVIDSPTNGPVDLIANGNFETGLTGWRVLGNHRHSEVITDPDNAGNHVLHLVSSGPQEHMHNHLETTYTGGRTVTDGRQYEISFRARWLAGNNLLNTRLYFNRVARTTVLPRPAYTGTPGAPNSRLASNIGPTFNGFRHQPAVPAAGEPVAVTVTAQDPQGVATCQLWWSRNGGAWSQTTMTGSNGTFSGTIPGYSAGDLVQFYTRATDTLGAVSTWPPAGPDSGALYAVNDGQADFNRGHNFRIILSPANRDLLHAFTNVMSNEELPATLIYDEYRPYYDVHVRLKGSERGRYSDTRVSFHIEFQPDDLFRGVHPVLLLDRSGAGDTGSNKQLEILIKHMLQHAGNIPGLYSDLSKVIAPLSRHSSSVILSPRHEDQFIESAYQNGGNGELYELELIYYPTTTDPATGNKYPNPDSVNTSVDIQDMGNDKELYRYNFIKKNHRDVDDYSKFMAMAKVFSLGGTALDQQTPLVTDLNEWLRAWALVSLCGVSDSYTFGNNHNLLMYLRPADNKFVAFPVDMDFSFVRGASSALIGDRNFSKIINNSFTTRRLFYAHVLEIIATTYNNAYMDSWTTHYNTFVPEQSYTGIPSYMQTRIATANSEIANAGGSSSFAVNGPPTVTTGNNLLVLTGTAPVQAAKIKVNGLDYPIVWNSLSAWVLRVPVAAATNQLVIAGYDVNDQPLANFSTTIQAYYTNAIPAAQGTVGFSEIMYHPVVPDAEYVELFNASINYTFDLSGWRINGLDYTFPQGAYIQPRSYLVLAKNRTAFQLAYPAASLFDTYSGNLQADGETITLFMPGSPETVVDRVRYEPNPPWVVKAAGQGAALQIVDFSRDHSRPLNWSDGSGWQFIAFTMTNTLTLSRTNLELQTSSAGEIYVDDLRVEMGTVLGGGTNLVVNGDFEAPLAGSWNLGTNMLQSTLSTTYKHSGNASLHLVANNRASALPGDFSQPMTLSNGTPYTVSFWYLPSPNVTNLTLFITSFVRSNVYVLGSSLALSPGAANPTTASLPLLPPLWLNEAQPENPNGAPWLELYNSGTNALSLDGWFLANNYTNLAQWAFPTGTVIDPGQFMLIWADGQPEQTQGTNLHTNFRLAPTNGQIALAMPLQGAPALLDYLSYSNIAAGYSYGDSPDGQMAYRRDFYWVSPGATNIPSAPPVKVFINEWMADNINTLADPADGLNEDWFELYNAGTNAADLAGYRLSDRTNDYYQIPNGYIIPPGGFLLVWADNSSGQNSTSRVDLHVNFALNRLGEQIIFSAPDGTVLDYVQFGSQTTDVSQGRYPDGSPNIAFLPTPTPRQPNAPGLVSPNTAPVLGPLPDRNLLLGQSVAFTVTATDADTPAQTLSFALGPDTLAGPTLIPSGEFSWTPPQVGTNLITVIVTDGGSPPLSATNAFLVRVGAPPKFTSGQLQISGGQIQFQLEALDGLSYRLEFKNSLQDTNWLTLEASRNPTNGVINFSEPATNRQRYYRVLQGP